MTPNQFRRIALGMNGAVEGSHMDHPDFRANGRIFATLYPDNARGMVKLTPEQQEVFMRSDPETFEPAAGAWGRQGCTTVRLSMADEATIGEALTLAWQAVVRQAAPKERSARVQTRSSSRRQTRSAARGQRR
jgi:YjbR protein